MNSLFILIYIHAYKAVKLHIMKQWIQIRRQQLNNIYIHCKILSKMSMVTKYKTQYLKKLNRSASKTANLFFLSLNERNAWRDLVSESNEGLAPCVDWFVISSAEDIIWFQFKPHYKTCLK